MNVYLDDHRICPKGFVLAKNAEECIALLKHAEVETLSLDYDLGWGQPTALEVVHYIVESKRFPKEIYLHTSSPSGRMQMYQLLARHAPMEVMLHNGPMPI
ncbi:cyclic-phosphate processing receiver domain-containing protein [Paenibacillus spongiae]|uniref:Cell division protein FtsJ n=1 Tax=Paenibacillus spongiae TaxID=2909671 RepID=A0ABY5S539_9BACL|nr:cyclic-phosphate processing receiver domain-containing protein [Paenibacillus spongiae]UVI27675.1 cell division protein FtsJ [Paenibacillus spongiae]